MATHDAPGDASGGEVGGAAGASADDAIAVQWDGAANLADLGGLRLVGGGRIRAGRVWRSAAREWLSEHGWREAKAAGLTRVVDLRNADEVGRGPHHPVVDEALLSGIEVVSVPTDAPQDPAFVARCVPWLDHPLSWAANAELCPQAFCDIFAAIADSPGAVLVHCAGGRDRTGMIISLLLSANGVIADDAVACYERGYRGAAGFAGLGSAYDPQAEQWVLQTDSTSELTGDDLADLLADRRPALLDWYAATDAAAYLHAVGLSEDQVARLSRVLRD